MYICSRECRMIDTNLSTGVTLGEGRGRQHNGGETLDTSAILSHVFCLKRRDFTNMEKKVSIC